MKYGTVLLGKYNIGVNTSDKVLNENDFRIIETRKSKIYISKIKQKVNDMLFWSKIVSRQGKIKKIELKNAEEKYRMNYSNMNDEKLYDLKHTHDSFLEKYLGTPHKTTIGTKMYIYEWGEIVSFIDNKTGECGILIEYN